MNNDTTIEDWNDATWAHQQELLLADPSYHDWLETFVTHEVE